MRSRLGTWLQSTTGRSQHLARRSGDLGGRGGTAYEQDLVMQHRHIGGFGYDSIRGPGTRIRCYRHDLACVPPFQIYPSIL